ncbi:MAG TPA: hypothetical protein VN175_09165 [Rhizomicrobium sp.]|jgi:hypothetical protein|nr:hypothetical protein [Rhizomicrobium sp.]
MTALANRACDACTVCCTELKIDTPQLRKPAGTPCRHLCAAGCGIYATRPLVCQQFLCGWRLFAELTDDWRPDRSGVLVMRKAPAELPPGYQSAPYGVELAITGGEQAVTRAGFAEYAASLLVKNVPVFLSASSPSTLLNEHVEPDIGLPALRQKLLLLYRLLHAARWKRGKLMMLLPLYRLLLDRQRFLAQKSAGKTKG